MDPAPIRAALILGASGGIGAALAAELATRGALVSVLSRSRDGLDVTDEASVAHHLDQAPGAFDLVFNATGALMPTGMPPEKTIAALDPQVMAAQFLLNATAVALILKHAMPLLAPGRAVFASLSARLGSIGDNRLGGWISYRAAKAAQNQILRSGAVELGRRHPGSIVVALHPGTVATGLTAPFRRPDQADAPALAARRLADVIERLRPADTGGFFDQHGRAVPW